jgi:hypothetical protein
LPPMFLTPPRALLPPIDASLSPPHATWKHATHHAAAVKFLSEMCKRFEAKLGHPNERDVVSFRAATLGSIELENLPCIGKESFVTKCLFRFPRKSHP